jgi:hypothetical protein
MREREVCGVGGGEFGGEAETLCGWLWRWSGVGQSMRGTGVLSDAGVRYQQMDLG